MAECLLIAISGHRARAINNNGENNKENSMKSSSDPMNGMRFLKDVLVSDFGLDLTVDYSRYLLAKTSEAPLRAIDIARATSCAPNGVRCPSQR